MDCIAGAATRHCIGYHIEMNCCRIGLVYMYQALVSTLDFFQLERARCEKREMMIIVYAVIQ